jgi:hypothetical protein
MCWVPSPPLDAVRDRSIAIRASINGHLRPARLFIIILASRIPIHCRSYRDSGCSSLLMLLPHSFRSRNQSEFQSLHPINQSGLYWFQSIRNQSFWFESADFANRVHQKLGHILALFRGSPEDSGSLTFDNLPAIALYSTQLCTAEAPCIYRGPPPFVLFGCRNVQSSVIGIFAKSISYLFITKSRIS